MSDDKIENIEENIEENIIENNNLDEKNTEELNNNTSIINSLKQALDDLNNKYIRVVAEYDNYRKRSLKERSLLFDNISSEVISNFLEIYDSILRSIQTNKNIDKKGNELILKQFEEILKKLNVEKIETNIKSKFDPNFHNAIIHINDDSYGENEIAEIMNDGFKIGNKVIRHAIVKVAN